MSRPTFALIAFLTLLSPATAIDLRGWSKLKVGMSPLQTVSALSVPVLRSAGRGFELWVYDNRSEVVFYGGAVVAWTVPPPDPGVDVVQPDFIGPVPPALYTPFLRSIAPHRDRGADGYSLREILRYKSGQ